MIEYHVHIRFTDHFKQIGVREKMTEMRSKVWNIETNIVVFKNKFKDKSKNLSIEVWSIGLPKLTKMIENHVHIDSQIILNRLGFVEK